MKLYSILFSLVLCGSAGSAFAAQFLDDTKPKKTPKRFTFSAAAVQFSGKAELNEGGQTNAANADPVGVVLVLPDAQPVQAGLTKPAQLIITGDEPKQAPDAPNALQRARIAMQLQRKSLRSLRKSGQRSGPEGDASQIAPKPDAQSVMPMANMAKKGTLGAGTAKRTVAAAGRWSPELKPSVFKEKESVIGLGKRYVEPRSPKKLSQAQQDVEKPTEHKKAPATKHEQFDQETLVIAIEQGDCDKVMRHLHKAISTSFRGSGGRTPLILAAQKNHIQIAEKILAKNKTNINDQDYCCMTALGWALFNDNAKLAGALRGAKAQEPTALAMELINRARKLKAEQALLAQTSGAVQVANQESGVPKNQL